MLKRFLIFVFILALLAGGAFYFINKSFLYNPLTFKKDEVTHDSWIEYKKPLEITYYVIKRGGRESIVITDPEEIRLVFEELKEGVKYKVAVDKDKPLLSVLEKSGRKMAIAITRLSDDSVLFTGTGYEESGLVSGRRVFIEFTDNLERLLKKRLDEAE